MSVRRWARKLGGRGQSFGATSFVAMTSYSHSNPRAAPLAARLDHAHARPRAAGFFRLPVAAAQRRDDALAAAERSVDDREAGERPLPLANRPVFLEQAHHPVGALDAREAVAFYLPAVAQAEGDRVGLRLRFELSAAQQEGFGADLA